MSSVQTEFRQNLAKGSVNTLADALVGVLKEAGIDTYFGVPGGAIEPFFNALGRQRRKGAARVVLTRGEAGAAYAADGYFREVGKMAVCTATTGPGASNLITGVMTAHADRIPMLVITPQVPLHKQGRGALQDSSPDAIDVNQMFKSCTRLSAELRHPDQLQFLVARLLRAALTAPMGPVHLALPSDLLVGNAPHNASAVFTHNYKSPKSIDWAALQVAFQMLRGSQAPVFYIGDDAGVAASSISDLGLACNIPVVSTPGGKRWLGHHHPAYRGVIGFSGHTAAKLAIDRADLVVAFGATFDELSTNGWTTPNKIPIVSVDSHCQHAHRMELIHPVLVDAMDAVKFFEKQAGVLAKLAPRLLALSKPQTVFESSACAEAKPTTGPVHPARLMKWLGGHVPDEVVIHVDAGNGFSWSTRHLQRKYPDKYRVAMGMGSMGWAISSVIGAAIANNQRAICVCGDGALLMSSLELTVAVQEQLPITYIVLNDSALGMVRHGQLLSGAESIACEIPTVRFNDIATACGAEAMPIASFSDLANIPQRMLGSAEGGPCLIDVQIDRNAIPPIAERLQGLKAVS